VKSVEQEQAKMRDRIRLERERDSLAHQKESSPQKERSPVRQKKRMVFSVRPEIFMRNRGSGYINQT
jgi:hypothetical protein